MKHEFNAFAETITKPTIVILDNASIHKANIIQAKRDEWKEQGLTLYFIPPYSPELNGTATVLLNGSG